ncbi:hypothetical protein ACFY19_20855 [Streptosporangium saharense]|uniref:hypothetical protein n=1 Tax=Streptosporangium saharense TaxID=1706840 RepID=UPI0036ABF199
MTDIRITPLASAPDELVDLLVATRTGTPWTPGEIRRAITAAEQQGRPWRSIMRGLITLAEIAQAHPSDLTGHKPA